MQRALGMVGVALVALVASVVACGSPTTDGQGSGGGFGSTSSGGASGSGGSSGGSGGSGGSSSTSGSSGSTSGASGSSGSGGSSGASSGASSGSSGASGSSGGSASGSSSGSSDGGSACLKAGSGDYSKAGPYTPMTKSVDLASLLPGAATPTTFTIYYPSTLEANCPHPIIAWGNGTGAATSVYAFYNNNAASWGMVVAASDNTNVGSGAYNKAGIDYLLAQNKDSTSPFYGKLSTRAGVAGHSQGAMGATVASAHANCQAEVQIEGGGNPKAGIAFLALSGSNDTVVTTGPPTSSYGAATGPSMLAVYTGGDHTTTPTLGGYVQNNPGTIQFLRFYTAWFRCFLGDDATACAMFKGGSSCGVCKDANWTTMQTKNM